MFGDNGVQTQFIRQRKKIAKRRKIKGNVWTRSLMLNQPVSPVCRPPFLYRREKRRWKFPDIHSSDDGQGKAEREREREGLWKEGGGVVSGVAVS